MAERANVWIYDLSRTSSRRQLTFGGKNRFPVWSPDGQHVAFQSDREGDLAIFWQKADGSAPAERLTKPVKGTSHVPESWSAKANRLAFDVIEGSSFLLWTLSFPDQERMAFRRRPLKLRPTCRSVLARRTMDCLPIGRNSHSPDLCANVPQHRHEVSDRERPPSALVT